MIQERMKLELYLKHGEPILEYNSAENELTELQMAFERLVYTPKCSSGRILTKVAHNGRDWEAVMYTLHLTEMSAYLLVDIVRQFPKEYRIAHLSRPGQMAFLKHLNILKDEGLIRVSRDFYGEYYEPAYDFIRVLASGCEWHPKTHSDVKDWDEWFNDL